MPDGSQPITEFDRLARALNNEHEWERYCHAVFAERQRIAAVLLIQQLSVGASEAEACGG